MPISTKAQHLVRGYIIFGGISGIRWLWQGVRDGARVWRLMRSEIAIYREAVSSSFAVNVIVYSAKL